MSVELKLKTERLDARIPADISRAADILRRGGTVAFPTETVYGLGANALSPEAVAKIFLAKQRPGWDPLIVHICDRAMLGQVADSTDRPGYIALMDAFWPGPLTLLLPRSSAVSDAVTAGRALVGVRMPKHPVALELIRQAGLPIAAPSANLFGHTSPTTAEHVLADLDGIIDAVLDGGPTEVGLESTVAEVTPAGVVVYRPGAVSLEMLDSTLGNGAARLYNETPIAEPQALPSPGVGIRHYAPRAELLLYQVHEQMPEAAQSFQKWIYGLGKSPRSLGIVLPDGWPATLDAMLFRWGPWEEPEVLAQRLYSGLHALDRQGALTIVCPVPGPDGIGLAIRDRLEKAAK